jgi:hypothetical protein
MNYLDDGEVVLEQVAEIKKRTILEAKRTEEAPAIPTSATKMDIGPDFYALLLAGDEDNTGDLGIELPELTSEMIEETKEEELKGVTLDGLGLRIVENDDAQIFTDPRDTVEPSLEYAGSAVPVDEIRIIADSTRMAHYDVAAMIEAQMVALMTEEAIFRCNKGAGYHAMSSSELPMVAGTETYEAKMNPNMLYTLSPLACYLDFIAHKADNITHKVRSKMASEGMKAAVLVAENAIIDLSDSVASFQGTSVYSDSSVFEVVYSTGSRRHTRGDEFRVLNWGTNP